ncbi:MAG: zinc metalloprotease HtpX [Sulfurovum sp.]|nr:zinc metalloprotease HtpX [Sulfurovaceae bacterium]
MERLKTYALMIGLMLVFIWFGKMIAGQAGMLIAFIIASGTNFYAYYYSDEQVLKHYNAIPVDSSSARELYKIVSRLTISADLPMPQIYIIPDPIPNAFATGRDYDHSAIAVTEGLLDLLDIEEVEGVIAHELSHIKHYDMLIGTVSASIAGAIVMLANVGMMFGGNNRDKPNPILMIALIVIMPMAASIIQMSVSRSREFMADEGAGKLTGHPEWLQSALSKLENYAERGLIDNADPETAHLFIINPFAGVKDKMNSLFSTHPSTSERIERLEELKQKMR